METVQKKVGVDRIELEGGGYAIRIGADRSLDDIYQFPGCPKVLKHALSVAVTWQERNETSLAKSLLAPSLMPDWIASLLAFDTELILEQGKTVKLSDYVLKIGKRDTVFSMVIPSDLPGQSTGVARVALTPNDQAIVFCAAGVVVEAGVVSAARIALHGVWSDRKWLAEAGTDLQGKPLSDDAISQVAAAVKEEVTPKTDSFNSAAYRREMAGVVVRRALEMCKKGA